MLSVDALLLNYICAYVFLKKLKRLLKQENAILNQNKISVTLGIVIVDVLIHQSEDSKQISYIFTQDNKDIP